MIDYLKDNYVWIAAIVVPIVVAIIGAVAVLAKKTDRKQKIKNINGDGNTVINGDVKK